MILGIAVAAGNAGCQGQDTLDGHTCPSGATTTSSTTTDDGGAPVATDPNAITYDNFARGFFDQWCQSCHAANVTDRNGAPDDIFFDTRDDIWRLRTQVYAQAAGANASMPIGPHGPTDADREKLADWLSCGAP
ncbi:MAG TPA: hypothetical protein VF407_08790 [Polyangiaceae bacterium]